MNLVPVDYVLDVPEAAFALTLAEFIKICKMLGITEVHVPRSWNLPT